MQSNVSYFRLITKIIPGVAGTGNTTTSFTFNDQPDLRYARMTGLVFLTDADMEKSQPEAAPLVSAALINKISFTFQTNDPDDMAIPGTTAEGIQKKRKGEAGRFSGTLDTVQWIPASLLHINQSNTPAGVNPSFVRNLIHWKDRYVIWQKSNILLSSPLLNTTDVAICLGAFYTFTTVEGKIIYPRN
jgi:hypothetical protein